MGISKKGKRTITCHQKQYVWWVKEGEEDFGTVWLNIVSSDKMLVLSYQEDYFREKKLQESGNIIIILFNKHLLQ